MHITRIISLNPRLRCNKNVMRIKNEDLEIPYGIVMPTSGSPRE